MDMDGFKLRIAAWSALALGIGYVVIVALYSWVGAPPSGGQEWLSYGAGKTGAWWWILALSVATDLLYLPVAAALWALLKPVRRFAAQAGAALLVGFVVLDLTVTWPNYAALIRLSGQAGAAVGAADYASAVLSSRLEAFYSIGVPAAGILLLGLAAWRGPLTRTTAIIGVATGVAGAVAVAGPALTHALDFAVILVSVLTLVWFLVLFWDLNRRART